VEELEVFAIANSSTIKPPTPTTAYPHTFLAADLGKIRSLMLVLSIVFYSTMLILKI
jgi:hypothetical protein